MLGLATVMFAILAGSMLSILPEEDYRAVVKAFHTCIHEIRSFFHDSELGVKIVEAGIAVRDAGVAVVQKALQGRQTEEKRGKQKG
ncbi:hypothetical protein CSKR_200254 [Clonorchis sinensis]|uniref:Uncharacterized protein n=1 Tax=Clonorchis sinensis TaxID=79923 RepID=A0A8T1M0P0_CLOSI|nr:hypothetical protein CSKR_200254 [Clonorchis sinensis]